MRTVGEILKEEREKRLYTLEEIEKVTKIRKELLEALENGQYQRLPPPTFIQGFIKSYGKFLGLNTEKLLAIFRREYSEKHTSRILQSLLNPVDKKGFRMTPGKFLVMVVLFWVIVFFAYLWFEYKFLLGAPFLEISQPQDQESFQSETLEVLGRTDPEAKVTINNQEIQVDSSGKFSQEVEIKEGINKLLVTSTSKTGKVKKIERTVFLRR